MSTASSLAQDPRPDASSAWAQQTTRLAHLGDQQSAAECERIATQALNEAAQGDNPVEMALARNQLGLCLQMTSRTQEASAVLEQAASDATVADADLLRAIIISNLARSRIADARYVEAVRLLKDESLPELRRAGASDREANALITLSTAQMQTSDYVGAIEWILFVP